MSMKRIAIAEATRAQLVVHAETIMGIEVGDRLNKGEIIALIQNAGWTQDSIVATETIKPTDSRGDRSPLNRRRRILAEGTPNERPALDENGEEVWEVRIEVHTQDKPGGSEPVFASVNGRGIWIPRGQAVWLWEAYVETLTHAEEHVYPEYTEGLGGLQEPRIVRAYPFQYA